MSGIYAILSNHGFGHISRSSSILAEFQERRPDVPLVVASAKPPALLAALFRPGFELRPVALDAAVVSSDSLSFDPAATLEGLRALEAREEELIAGEAAFIRERAIDLVIADIPPLAVAAARAAGRPCWLWGNFGWDYIYRGWSDLPRWGADFARAAERAARMYADCELCFRLPFHAPMEAFPRKIDVGVTGRPARSDPRAIARRLGLDGRPVVLLAFGGLGLDRAPLENTAALDEFQFVSFQSDAAPNKNLVLVRDEDIQPKDLLGLADRVLSKPGYGMFTEILQRPRPFYCLEREGWAETPLLLEALRLYFEHRIVRPEEFFAGDWNFLKEPVRPLRGTALGLDGNDVILSHLQKFFS